MFSHIWATYLTHPFRDAYVCFVFGGCFNFFRGFLKKIFYRNKLEARFLCQNIRLNMPFTRIPNLWGFTWKNFENGQKDRYLSFGDSLFFLFLDNFPKNLIGYFLNFWCQNILFWLNRTRTFCFFWGKIIFWVFGGYFYTKILNFFKKSCISCPKKFLNRLFFQKTYLSYVELCQEHAGDSGFPRKNRFWGQNGQKYANFIKIS